MRTLVRLLFAALLVAVVGACSSDRMWRISPLQGETSSDRVNVWPLVYHDSGATSVLWPVFDVDDRGFAVRPLLAKDGPRWSALWPLSSWNTDTGSGWAGPFYRFENDAGLFPVANFGEVSWVGTAWWRDEGVGHGLFPLYGFGDVARHVGPFWWKREREDGHRKAGLLPLFWFDTDGSELGILPFYTHSLGSEIRTRTALLGLGYSRDDPGRSIRWLLPFYWEQTLWGPSTGGTRWPAKRHRVLFPLFYYGEDGDDRALVTPLGGRGWTASGEQRFVNVLGPLYFHSESTDGEASRTSFLWPLFERHRDGDETTTRVFPLFSVERGPDRIDVDYLAWLGKYTSAPGESAWRLWPLVSATNGTRRTDPLHAFTFVGSEDWDGGERFHFATPLVYDRRSFDDAERRSTQHRLLLFFQHRDEEHRTLAIPQGDRPNRWNRVASRDTSFFFELFVSRRESFRVWRDDARVTEAEAAAWAPLSERAWREPDEREQQIAREHLTRRGFETEPSDADALRRALADFVAENSEVREHRRFRLPFLYSYARTGDEVAWSGPLWLVQSRKDAEAERFNLLYYGYRSETRGEETTRDIFPFITWDTGPDRIEVSFLWRLFHYRSDGEESGGHVLFVPWGEP